MMSRAEYQKASWFLLNPETPSRQGLGSYGLPASRNGTILHAALPDPSDRQLSQSAFTLRIPVPGILSVMGIFQQLGCLRS
jgi:hypothetical protein